MKTEHTPEPWATNGTRIESEHSHGWANDGWIIAGLEGPDAEANARRIVACVNVCAGIPTEVLERYKLGVIGVDYKLTKQQRDKLLAACDALLEWDFVRGFRLPYKVRDPIIAAIKEVK